MLRKAFRVRFGCCLDALEGLSDSLWVLLGALESLSVPFWMLCRCFGKPFGIILDVLRCFGKPFGFILNPFGVLMRCVLHGLESFGRQSFLDAF